MSRRAHELKRRANAWAQSHGPHGNGWTHAEIRAELSAAYMAGYRSASRARRKVVTGTKLAAEFYKLTEDK